MTATRDMKGFLSLAVVSVNLALTGCASDPIAKYCGPVVDWAVDTFNLKGKTSVPKEEWKVPEPVASQEHQPNHACSAGFK
jgi:hypothetical protein